MLTSAEKENDKWRKKLEDIIEGQGEDDNDIDSSNANNESENYNSESNNNDENDSDDVSDEECEDTDSDRQENVIRVTLRRCSGSSYGFNIEGGCDTPLQYVCIESLVPGSPATGCGLFRKGDQLVMIGDECMIGVTNERAHQILKETPAVVRVIAQRKFLSASNSTSYSSYPSRSKTHESSFSSSSQTQTTWSSNDPLFIEQAAGDIAAGPHLPGIKMIVELKCRPGEKLGINILGGEEDPYLKHIHVS